MHLIQITKYEMLILFMQYSYEMGEGKTQL